MKTKTLIATTTAFTLFAGSASAAPIFIANHSFEDDDIADNTNANSAPSGWSVTGAGGASYLDRNGTGGFNDQIDPTPDATDSEQMAWSNGSDFYQETGTAVAANTVYTLTVDVGDRTNTNFQPTELRLGIGATFGTNLLTANVVANTAPTNGAGPSDGWETWVTTFTTGASPTAGNLRVEIVNNGGVQPLYDNVRLTESLVPEPSSSALLGLSGLLIARRRRD